MRITDDDLSLPTVSYTSDKLLSIIAAMAINEEHSTTSTNKQSDKKQKSKYDHDWGILDVKKWLDDHDVRYSIKQDGTRSVYQLKQCLFDPTHTDKEASIVQDSTGMLTYHCFHSSCNHTFREAKERISGSKNLREYMTGYDPNLKPRKKTAGSGLLKNIEIEKTRPVFPASDSPAVPPPDKIDPKEFFAETMKGKFAFVPEFMAKYYVAYFEHLVHSGGVFYVYKNGLWEEISEYVLHQVCVKAMKEYIQPTMIDGSIKILRGMINIEPKDWVETIGYINCLNGMIKVDTCELLPHDPQYFSRTQIPCTYDVNEMEKCERWYKFLEEIFPNEPEKHRLLQECFGYCLLTDCRYEKMFFFVGGGGNGKGTVLSVLTEMIGKENISSLTMRDLSDPKFSLYFLQDKLVNVATELSHRDPVATEHLKTIVSGEWLTAERKHGHKFQFKPYSTMILAMNDLPVVPDRSYGFERRLIIIRFNIRFTDENKDPQLKDKLIDERDGIFVWAVAGLSRLLSQNDFSIGKALETDKTEFIKALHPLLQFVEEMCEIGEKEFEEAEELYKGYNKWCKAGNYRALAKNRFTDHLMLNFPGLLKKPFTKSRRMHFLGISLKQQVIPSE